VQSYYTWSEKRDYRGAYTRDSNVSTERQNHIIRVLTCDRIGWPFAIDQPLNVAYMAWTLDVGFEFTNMRANYCSVKAGRYDDTSVDMSVWEKKVRTILNAAFTATGERKRILIHSPSMPPMHPVREKLRSFGNTAFQFQTQSCSIVSTLVPASTRRGNGHSVLAEIRSQRPLLNSTLLPDEFLRRWSPLFTTRHPASTFSSYYRVLTSSESHKEKVLRQKTMVNIYHWTRSLYDCYKQSLGI
jgi:hypothetical protein